jgi:cation diffusion facilitator family transporter
VEQAARWSVFVGFFALLLKFWAAFRTASLALLSDALESVVNVAAAGMLWVAVRVASRPADANHPYGHAKAEYLSAAVEGALVIGAAGTILWQALLRFGQPPRLPELGVGLGVAVVATLANAGLALWLHLQGKRLRSPALLADALHVRSDVLTSAAVFLGFGLAWLTGWWPLDAWLAIGVAVHILFAGIDTVRGSLAGLMDESLEPSELERIAEVLNSEGAPVVEHHGLRTRRAGQGSFVEFHLVVEGRTSVEEAHAICDRLERKIESVVPGAEVTIHLEPEGEAKMRRQSGAFLEYPGWK